MYKKEQVLEATKKYFNDDELATNVFFKYALKNDEGFLELTPDDMHRRLAKEFARIEKKYPNPISEEEIFNLFKDFKWVVPQGSPMYGIGNNYSLSSLSNCVVVDNPADNVTSIMDAGKDLANLFKRRCGVGVDITTLRPENAKVNNSAGTTTGAWSFADFYSYVCRMIGQNGRRGALMISIDVRHPDVEKFALMKQDLKKVTGANVSIRVTDDFMKAVETDSDFVLHYPVGSTAPTFTKTIKAKDLWNVIINSATKSAEPGLLMWDNIINNLPAHCYPSFKTLTTNPCITSDTLIAVADGRNYVSIGQLTKEGKDVPVYSTNLVSGQVEIKMGRNPRLTGQAKEIWKLTLDDGSTFRATPDHRILKRDLSYTQLKDLKPGDSLYPFNSFESNIHKVVSVEYVGQEDVYNITVDDNHNYHVITKVSDEKGVVTSGFCVKNCGEIPLSAYDSCRLISINLKHLVTNAFTKDAQMDMEKLERVTKMAMRLSDDLIDLEIEKLVNIINLCDTESEKELWNKLLNACRNGRRTGLGTHGLADAVARCGIRYDSEEGIALIDKIYNCFRDAAYSTSVDLAEERGAFPIFDWELEKNNDFIQRLPEEIKEKMAKAGRRNIALLTNAPTGSVSIESQTSSGIEPVFKNSYTRRRKLDHSEQDTKPDFVDDMGDRWINFKVYHKNVQEYLKFANTDITPDFFVESDNINWQNRVRIQATIQKYIDHSISSTINLPKGTTPEVVGELYMNGWRLGLKGITVYVDGSRDGVLITTETKKDTFKQHAAIKRKQSLNCGIHHVSVKGEKWLILVGLFDGKPYEVFGGLADKIEIPTNIKIGEIIKKKSGHYLLQVDDIAVEAVDIKEAFENTQYSDLTRLVSLSLRHGADVKFVVEQILKSETTSMTTFSKAVARVLKLYIKEGEEVTGSTSNCPECNSKLVYQDGCATCKDGCGWSKCY
jgi:ribonucleotide reductase alpha subunit